MKFMSLARLWLLFIGDRACRGFENGAEGEAGQELTAKASRCSLEVKSMRYVSQIDGGVGSIRCVKGEDFDPFVTIRDLDDKSFWKTCHLQELYNLDIHGVGQCARDMFAVAMTPEQVSLHKHLKRAYTSNGRGMSMFPGADYIVIQSGHLYSESISRNVKKNTVSVDVYDNSPELFGKDGSVVSYINRLSQGAKFCTLYDYLLWIYVSSGVDIFGYDKLHFFSELRNRSNVVEFEHDSESARFFLKMRMLKGEGIEL